MFENKVAVVTGGFRHGAGLAVAGEGTVDESGVDRFQGFVAQTQLFHDAGAELLNNNVIFLDELLDDGNGLRVFQVQEDVSLVAPQPSLIGSDVGALHEGLILQHDVPLAGGADLEHLRAQVRQHQGGVWAREQGGEIQDFQTFQCFHRQTSKVIFFRGILPLLYLIWRGFAKVVFAWWV